MILAREMPFKSEICVSISATRSSATANRERPPPRQPRN